jgi:hypothetical protein
VTRLDDERNAAYATRTRTLKRLRVGALALTANELLVTIVERSG